MCLPHKSTFFFNWFRLGSTTPYRILCVFVCVTLSFSPPALRTSVYVLLLSGKPSLVPGGRHFFFLLCREERQSKSFSVAYFTPWLMYDYILLWSVKMSSIYDFPFIHLFFSLFFRSCVASLMKCVNTLDMRKIKEIYIYGKRMEVYFWTLLVLACEETK